jgi:hypothetical protein
MIVEICDRRLGPDVPKITRDRIVLVADRSFPVALPFATARAVAIKRPIAVLRIFAHRNSGELQLGREAINSSTVYLFSSLAGAFQKDAVIALHSCQMVDYLEPSVGPGGDQKRSSLPGFLKRMAEITKVPVLASPDIQYFDGQTLEFGKLEGRVCVITPSGALIRVPDLGSWHEGEMEKAGLSKGVIRLIQGERGGPYSPAQVFSDEPVLKHGRL